MKELFCSLGIVVGVLMIVFGLHTASESRFLGETTYKVEFGGDFYTEIYSVTKDAVEDINKLGDVIAEIEKAFGYFVSLLGAMIICLFGSKLCEKKEVNVVVPEAKPAQVVVEKEEKKEDLLPTI